jgi:hypothetical protein
VTNYLRENHDQIKAILVNTKGTPTQKLLAILMQAGIDKTADLAELTGLSERAVQIAKRNLFRETHCVTKLVAAKPIAETKPIALLAKPVSVAHGPARVEDNNLLTNLETTVEIKESKILPRSAEPKPKKQVHGTRLDLDWTLSDDLRQWTRTTFPQTTPDRLAAELETFRDYWASVAGQKGRKADWDATWRNWSRRAFATAPLRPNAQPPPLRPQSDRDIRMQQFKDAIAKRREAAHAN